MIIAEKTFSPPPAYPLERLGSPEELLFFDIETTGFSAASSGLYLIGAAYVRGGQWHLVQWFADRPEAEAEILTAFFSFLAPFSVLVHFNGDGFDIPYLEKRSAALGLSCPLSSMESLDIYRKIRPFRKLLGLDSLKQKAVERFLGIFREDPYSGGELIRVYGDYLLTGEDSLFRMLMLHNEEDLMGMPLILPILFYPDFLTGSFSPVSCGIRTKTDLFGQKESILDLECLGESPLPVPVSWEHPLLEAVRFQAEGEQMTVSVPLFEGELKYFYPDYRNYYYLIYEDTAVHKSVGEFVDRTARKKATASSCYTKKRGLFLPQAEPCLSPVFRTDLRAKVTYGLLPEDPLSCPRLADYVRGLVSSGLRLKAEIPDGGRRQ